MKLVEAMKHPFKVIYSWLSVNGFSLTFELFKVLGVMLWIFGPLVILVLFGEQLLPYSLLFLPSILVVISVFLWVVYWGWVWMKVEEE